MSSPKRPRLSYCRVASNTVVPKSYTGSIKRLQV